jgi:hypothetical protein
MKNLNRKTANRGTAIIGILALIAMFIPAAGRAQSDEPAEASFWLNAGFGASTIGVPAMNADFNVQSGQLLITARTSVYIDTIIFGSNEYYDMALLVGYASRHPKFHTSISLGLARVSGYHYVQLPALFFNRDKVPIRPTVGIVLESQLIWKVSNLLGIGLIPYVNINRERSFMSLNLCFALGKLN